MTKNKRKSLSLFILAVILFLSLVQLFISHRLATTGEMVRQFEIRASQIEEANNLLEEEIGGMGSLSRISQEAEKLGLKRTSDILYLTPQVPVALGY